STVFKYDTIDKKNQILITLPSLFKDESYVDIISENIKAQMREQMKEDEGKIYWVSGAGIEEPVELFERISKEQSFYINDDSKLVISFDKYEVAPGYMGVIEFVIPTETIKDILAGDEYIK
ncbi:MAG TPA: anti-sigma factor, partial [Clostridiaceae bacterium]|nr:anti-sigma factor [Clostridiaceae bacterium]